MLPREAQKAIWRMYLARFVLAGSCVAIAVAMLSGLALLPMYLALHSADEAASASLQAKNSEIQNERAEIARAQSLITTLSPYASSSSTLSEAIEAALALRPKGVFVDHITYSSGDSSAIVLVGSAATRDGINTYRQALQPDMRFKTVSVPVGDLAGSQGGRFSVTLTGKF